VQLNLESSLQMIANMRSTTSRISKIAAVNTDNKQSDFPLKPVFRITSRAHHNRRD